MRVNACMCCKGSSGTNGWYTTKAISKDIVGGFLAQEHVKIGRSILVISKVVVVVYKGHWASVS